MFLPFFSDLKCSVNASTVSSKVLHQSDSTFSALLLHLPKFLVVKARTGPSTNHFDSLTGSENGVTKWRHDGQTSNLVRVAVPNRNSMFFCGSQHSKCCIIKLPLVVGPYMLHRCTVKPHFAVILVKWSPMI